MTQAEGGGGEIYIETFWGEGGGIVMGTDHYGRIIVDVYLLLLCVFTMKV
jgi:hypothetical protein